MTECKLKLYAWQPLGHGQQSMFVMARSEEKALTAVKNKIREEIKENDNFPDYDFSALGVDFYELTIVDENVVLLNEND